MRERESEQGYSTRVSEYSKILITNPPVHSLDFFNVFVSIDPQEYCNHYTNILCTNNANQLTITQRDREREREGN